MKPVDYVKVFDNVGTLLPIWSSVHHLLSKALEANRELEIQQACNECGISLKVDGIVGQNTIKAIGMCNPKLYIEALHTLLDGSKVKRSTRDVIMGYLAKAEGMHLHWNKGEKDFTTMYGVYAHSFPNSAPVQYVRELARRHDIKLSRGTIRQLDTALSVEERVKLQNLIYDFYLANFMDSRVNKHLGELSALTFFSNSVNGGRGRGYKALQTSIGVTADGAFGNRSLQALEKVTFSDEVLNQRMGDYMFDFYSRLAVKPKFKRFFNGWVNRLKGLGWKK